MKSLIGLAIIALLAIFGSRSFEARFPIPKIFRRFFTGGLVYLAIGFVMGPSVLKVIDNKTLVQMAPVVTIALFWIGMLFGMNLFFKDFKRFSKSIYSLAFGQSTFTLLLVGAVSYLLLRDGQKGFEQNLAVASAITLAACASGTAQSNLIRLSANRMFRGHNSQVATLAATLDDIPGILATGLLALFWYRTLPGQTELPGIVWVAVSLFLGVAGGFLIRPLLSKAENDQVRLLIIMAAASLGGGLTAYMHLSPILVGVVLGMTYVNVSEHRDLRVFEIVHRSESTLYILFLLLVGATVKFQFDQLLVLLGAYLFFRTAGKFLGAIMFRPPKGDGPRMSRFLGLSMLSQGGMAVALAVQHLMLTGSPLADKVATVVIIGVLANEAVAEPLAVWVANRGRR